MELITVYLKRVKNNDIRFVYVYNNKDATDLKAIFNSTLTSLPNKRRKMITLNHFKYKVEWLS